MSVMYIALLMHESLDSVGDPTIPSSDSDLGSYDAITYHLQLDHNRVQDPTNLLTNYLRKTQSNTIADNTLISCDLSLTYKQNPIAQRICMANFIRTMHVQYTMYNSLELYYSYQSRQDHL